LTIYANGLGEVVEGLAEGGAAPLDRQIPLNHKVRVVIGDVEADSAFASLAPGTVGVFEVNVQLPQNAPAGQAVPLHLEVLLPDGTVVASNTVTAAIDAAAPAGREALK